MRGRREDALQRRTSTPDFIVDGLRNCERDLVRLEFNDRTSPGKFTLGEEYIYIVMPITADA